MTLGELYEKYRFLDIDHNGNIEINKPCSYSELKKMMSDIGEYFENKGEE